MNTFTIRPQGPFSWETMADTWFSNWQPVKRHRPEVGTPIRLAFPLDGTFEPAAVSLTWRAGELHGEIAGSADLDSVRRQVARIFSLDFDATTYPEIAEGDPALRSVMDRFRGLRPLLFTSPYECAAWGIISQGISMRQAAALQHRLLEEHGDRLRLDGGEVIAFPTPARLLEIRSVPGLAAVKVERLHGVAAAALAGKLDPYRLRELGEEAGPESVRAIPGIGPFWSSAIYLRAAGVTDVFPSEPKSIAALAALKGLDHLPSRAELEALVEPYRPWRMWACVLLRVAAPTLSAPPSSAKVLVAADGGR